MVRLGELGHWGLLCDKLDRAQERAVAPTGPHLWGGWRLEQIINREASHDPGNLAALYEIFDDRQHP
ncbi:hypothetical protein EGK76_00280 [Luteimonas sp. 100069]|nr:hypothetical protein EGK76_00280 [Luteimonas sp. 100069]